MSWHYSQALEEAFLEASCWDGGPCAPSRLQTFPEPGCWIDRMTGASFHSRFGTTLLHSTAPNGQAVLTWCREAFLARTSALPDEASASPDPAADSGNTLPELSPKYVLSLHLLKTVRPSKREGLNSSSPTLPQWGTMRAGVCSEQSIPALPTAGLECGLWPTILHSEARQGLQIRRPGSKGTQQSLSTKVKMWPTPRLNTGPSTDPLHLSLDGAVRMWPTPVATEVQKDLGSFQTKRSMPRSKRGGGHGPNLATAVSISLIPTPTTSDCKRGDRTLHCQKNPRAGMDLGTYVRNFPTPTIQDAHNNGGPSQLRRNRLPLNALVGGRLNPDWVEWLMGWPIGWTASKPLAMDRFRKWPHSHGIF